MIFLETRDVRASWRPLDWVMSSRSRFCGLILSLMNKVVAFNYHSSFTISRGQLSSVSSSNYLFSFSKNFMLKKSVQLGPSLHSLREQISAEPLNGAITSMPVENLWLSYKDVEKILREKGPGSMRPNPLVPAERYRSSYWIKSILTAPTALQFTRVVNFLLANTLFSIFVWALSVAFPKTVAFLTAGLGPQPHLLVGGALGLLLVFRTNTAYDRFWEGRRLWGFLISRVREVCASGMLENVRERRRVEGVARGWCRTGTRRIGAAEQ